MKSDDYFSISEIVKIYTGMSLIYPDALKGKTDEAITKLHEDERDFKNNVYGISDEKLESGYKLQAELIKSCGLELIDCKKINDAYYLHRKQINKFFNNSPWACPNKLQISSKYSLLHFKDYFSAYEIACVQFNEELNDNEEPFDSSYLDSKDDNFLKFMLHLLESKSDYTIDFYTFKSDPRIFMPLFTRDEITEWYINKPDKECPSEFYILLKIENSSHNITQPEEITIRTDVIDTQEENKKQPEPQQEEDSNSKIKPLPQPKKKDTWTEAIISSIQMFELKEERTPTDNKLWDFLINKDIDGFVVRYNKSEKNMTVEGEAPLNKANFKKRFARLYK